MIGNYQVIINKKARRMLLNCMNFLENVSENAANKLLDEYLKAIQRLKYFPYSYPYIYIENIEDRYRKLLFYKRYLIIYQIEKDKVFIDYIVAGRQNYLKYIK